MPYTGRIAPSPTGLLHLGHARTFWIAYQRAIAANGTLLFRNEDLDPHRSRPEFVGAMIEDLQWLGIQWQPPIITQSERIPLYREALNRLLAAGHIYPCRCSRKDLARAISAPHEDTDDEPIYPGTCRPKSATSDESCHPEHREGPAFRSKRLYFQPNTNYRFRVPDNQTIRFVDLNLGPQSFTTNIDFGDFLVWRKDNLPSYQLACVIDDHAMQITEVVRGRDLLKSTARQILLQQALNLPTPHYFHTELMPDENGQRLAKRHDALSLRTLRQNGISPQELLADFNSGE